MAKSREAFRTISEVSKVLDTPTHVLRFWESKFTQIKPVKRAGGRRYYRPDDLRLLSGIKELLHEQGMTIKGAQKLLREQGVKHVMALGAIAPQIDDPAQSTAATAADKTAEMPSNVVSLDTASVTAPPQTRSAVPPSEPATIAQTIATLKAADPDLLRRNADQIRPLITRLELLRDRMRAE